MGRTAVIEIARDTSLVYLISWGTLQMQCCSILVNMQKTGWKQGIRPLESTYNIDGDHDTGLLTHSKGEGVVPPC